MCAHFRSATASALDGPARDAGDDLPVGEDVGDQGRDRDEQDVHEQQVVEAQVLALEGEQGELDRCVLVAWQEVERAGKVVEDEYGLDYDDRHHNGPKQRQDNLEEQPEWP